MSATQHADQPDSVWYHEDKHRSENMPLVAAVPAALPPKAVSEMDDSDDNGTQLSEKPFPGMDDSFFTNGGNETIPEIHNRAGFDDIPDGKPPVQPSLPGNGGYAPGHFPYAPGFGPHRPDTEFGGIPDLESIPDLNVYQHKKTLAQGMMDLALFSANANQLRYVLESTSRHPYYYPSIVLISLSLILQVAIGVGLIWNSRYNVKDEKEICIANKVNNYTVIGIFIVTSVNVFISAFGVATPAPT